MHRPRLALERWFFWSSALVATSMYWISPWLQMVDAPQHAAQIQMFREVLGQRFPWQELVTINWLTPYWLGYGVTLILSFLVSIPTALKLTLSLAWAGFVGSSVYLRRQLGAPSWWDWLSLPAFFGFAHEWGFVNFLVAVPLGILGLGVVRQGDPSPSWQRSAGLTLLCLGLFFCHLLVMLYVIAAASLMALTRSEGSPVKVLRGIAPFLATLPFVALWWFLGADPAGQSAQPFVWQLGWHRATQLPLLLTGLPFVGILVLGAFAVIPLTGSAFKLKHPDVIPFFLLVGILLLAPHQILGNAYTYQRFAVLLPSAIILAFEPSAEARETSGALRRRLSIILPVCTALILALQVLKAQAFAAEVTPFSRILAAMKPNARVLAMVFENTSRYAFASPTYLHFPVWYQSVSGGLVDVNFACFYPQIVRYKPADRPFFVHPYEWSPGKFNGIAFLASGYRYAIVRSSNPLPDELTDPNTGLLHLVTRDSDWWLYERATQAANARSR